MPFSKAFRASIYKNILLGSMLLALAVAGVRADKGTRRKRKPHYVHSIIRRKGCRACHSLHGGRHRYMLTHDSRELCLSCHRIGHYDYTHGPIAVAACTDCHRAHTSSYQKLLQQESNLLCLSCHTRLARQWHKGHRAGGGKRCVVCHQAHGSAYRYLLRRPRSQSCQGCHQLKPGDYTHGPVAVSDCRACHQPHAGGKLLRQTGNALCLSCHTRLTAKSKTATGRVLLRKKRCLVCHQAHSATQRYLLRRPRSQGCQGCHQLQPGDYTHGPVAVGDCRACHQPHAGGKLLRQTGNALCLSCHTRLASKSQTTPGRILSRQKRCIVCHQAHGSKYRYLLRSPQRQGCQGCHQLKPGDYIHGPVAVGDCRACHQPHAGGKLLRQRGNALCLSCHTRLANKSAVTTRHSAFKKQACVSCHTPHSSRYRFLLRKPGAIDNNHKKVK